MRTVRWENRYRGLEQVVNVALRRLSWEDGQKTEESFHTLGQRIWLETSERLRTSPSRTMDMAAPTRRSSQDRLLLCQVGYPCYTSSPYV